MLQHPNHLSAGLPPVSQSVFCAGEAGSTKEDIVGQTYLHKYCIERSNHFSLYTLANAPILSLQGHTAALPNQHLRLFCVWPESNLYSCKVLFCPRCRTSPFSLLNFLRLLPGNLFLMHVKAPLTRSAFCQQIDDSLQFGACLPACWGCTVCIPSFGSEMEMLNTICSRIDSWEQSLALATIRLQTAGSALSLQVPSVFHWPKRTPVQALPLQFVYKDAVADSVEGLTEVKVKIIDWFSPCSWSQSVPHQGEEGWPAAVVKPRWLLLAICSPGICQGRASRQICSKMVPEEEVRLTCLHTPPCPFWRLA